MKFKKYIIITQMQGLKLSLLEVPESLNLIP